MGQVLYGEEPVFTTIHTYYHCRIQSERNGGDSILVKLYRYSLESLLTTCVVPARDPLSLTLLNVTSDKYYNVTIGDCTHITEIKEVYPEVSCIVTGVTPTSNYDYNRVTVGHVSIPFILVPSSVKLVANNKYSIFFEWDSDDNRVAKRILDEWCNEIYPKKQ